MNMNSFIEDWADRVRNNLIIEGKYDASNEEFPQSDETEYEDWMSEREKIMKELAPKSVKEDPKNVKECDALRPMIDEAGIIDNMKRAINFWKTKFGANKQLWDNVVQGIKDKGGDGINALSGRLTAALDNKKKDKNILVRLGGDKGSNFNLDNGVISDFKGLHILCFTSTPDTTKGLNMQGLLELMKNKKLRKLSDINGIAVIHYGDHKKFSDEKKLMSGNIIVDAKDEGDNIILIPDENTTKDDVGDEDMKSYFSV